MTMTTEDLIGWNNRIQKLPANKQVLIWKGFTELVIQAETAIQMEKDGTLRYPAETILLARGGKIRAVLPGESELLISPAPPTGNNPNSIYIKVNGDYKGKVKEKKISWSGSPVSEAVQKKIISVLENPKQAAEEYGKITGNCSICGLKLTKEESIANGIGPICAEKLGF